MNTCIPDLHHLPPPPPAPHCACPVGVRTCAHSLIKLVKDPPSIAGSLSAVRGRPPTISLPVCPSPRHRPTDSPALLRPATCARLPRAHDPGRTQLPPTEHPKLKPHLSTRQVTPLLNTILKSPFSATQPNPPARGNYCPGPPTTSNSPCKRPVLAATTAYHLFVR